MSAGSGLPIFQDPNKNFMLMQTGWAAKLNPVLTNIILQGKVLTGISLNTGANTIQTNLGYTQQGYMILDQQGSASLDRTAPFNSNTLVLTASAPCTVNILVF